MGKTESRCAAVSALQALNLVTPSSNAHANVAALSERPVRGYSNAEEHWCTVALP